MQYDYQCPNCKGTHTEYHRMSEHKADVKPLCARCNSKMSQIIYPSLVRFQGQGFHETDYNKKSFK